MSAVCQHGAMQICEGEESNSTFKCPYHHWIYAQDGVARRAGKTN